MSSWWYVAISADGSNRRVRGQIAGSSAAAARAELRSAGLRVLDLTPAQTERFTSLSKSVRDPWLRHVRARRRTTKAQLYDGLATLLEAGVPLLEAVETCASSSRKSSNRAMLTALSQSLSGGGSLSDSMTLRPGWFDAADIAMVSAGEHRGELASVLRSLADRHERSSALTSKLIGALTYPTVIAVVGLGVAVFLGTRTLPQLVSILRDADVGVPVLTRVVMTFGQLIVGWWPLLACLLLVVVGAALLALPVLIRALRARGVCVDRAIPALLRSLLVAQFARGMAELGRAGVPAVESLRISADALHGPGAPSLSTLVRSAASSVEDGQELDSALSDPVWFNAEFARLIHVGQSSGELDALLARIADRTERETARLIDRFAALVEPAVIIVLAGLVGLVVMAAVLPLIKLQEVL